MVEHMRPQREYAQRSVYLRPSTHMRDIQVAGREGRPLTFQNSATEDATTIAKSMTVPRRPNIMRACPGTSNFDSSSQGNLESHHPDPQVSIAVSQISCSMTCDMNGDISGTC